MSDAATDTETAKPHRYMTEEQAMRSFITPAKFYGSLAAFAVVICSIIGAIILLSGQSQANAAKAEVAPTIAKLDTRVSVVEERQGGTEAKLDALDKKIDTKIGETHTRITGVESAVTTTRGELAGKIDGVERKTDKVIDLLISGRR